VALQVILIPPHHIVLILAASFPFFPPSSTRKSVCSPRALPVPWAQGNLQTPTFYLWSLPSPPTFLSPPHFKRLSSARLAFASPQNTASPPSYPFPTRDCGPPQSYPPSHPPSTTFLLTFLLLIRSVFYPPLKGVCINHCSAWPF